MRGGGILPAQERTGCRVQSKLKLDVTITTQRHDKQQSSDDGIPTERTNTIPSSGAQVTLFSLKNIFYSLFISQTPAAHWSLHASTSHSLASL